MKKQKFYVKLKPNCGINKYKWKLSISIFTIEVCGNPLQKIYVAYKTDASYIADFKVGIFYIWWEKRQKKEKTVDTV